MTTAIPEQVLAAFEQHCDDVREFVAIAESWPAGTSVRAGAEYQAARSLALAEALRDEACA